jgi:hypothetical protein
LDLDAIKAHIYCCGVTDDQAFALSEEVSRLRAENEQWEKTARDCNRFAVARMNEIEQLKHEAAMRDDPPFSFPDAP